MLWSIVDRCRVWPVPVTRVSVHHLTWHHKTVEVIDWLLTFKKIYIWWQYSTTEALFLQLGRRKTLIMVSCFPLLQCMRTDVFFYTAVYVYTFLSFQKIPLLLTLAVLRLRQLTFTSHSIIYVKWRRRRRKKIIFHRFLTDKTWAHRSSSLHTCSPLSP